MKQVKPTLYNQKYFDFQSNSSSFNNKLKISDFHKKYHEIISLISLSSSDHVCDYGCGNGDLSFLIYLKSKCKITAIDYSSDAIKICLSKLDHFKKNTDSNIDIKFLNKNNQNIPKLKNIKAVFFCDVFEHLYNHEIDYIIKQIFQWNNPKIIIHTDNNIYLKYIYPIANLLALLTRKTTIKKLKAEHLFHQKRHVNLTNPKKLTLKMNKLGYELVKIKYPNIDKKTIKIQLGNLSKYPFLINISFFLLKIFPFLSPSFYALYKRN